ncbi:MAG: AI-2E family transporter [Firmicutes bacterium]|nr:AI-2E family transporter [Bacillota bacterium]
MDKKKLLLNASNFLKYFLFAAAVIVFYKTVDNLGPIFASIVCFFSFFAPLLGALLLVFFLRRPAGWLERKFAACRLPFLRRFARGFGVLVVYLGLFAVVGVIIGSLLPMLISGLGEFIGQIPTYLKSLQNYAAEIRQSDNPLAGWSLWNWVGDLTADKLLGYLPAFDGENIASYLNGAKNISSTLLNIFISVVLSVYILLERKMLWNFVRRVVRLFGKPAAVKRCAEYLRSANTIVFRYFFGQLCDSLIVSVLAAIILTLLGVPYGIVLGFLFGMFNLIPYFGPIFIFFVVILITFLSCGWMTALWAAILLLVMQQLDANIMNPKILGTTLDISPFWVILSVTIGGDLFGMAGMLFSVPVFAVIRMLVLDCMDYREKKKEDALCPEKAPEQEDAPDAGAAEKENPPAETVPPEENGQDQ